MKPRLCNILGCTGEMRPTRELVSYNKDHRFFRCVICGNVTPWLDKPKEGSTAFASLHITKDGLASGLSMMSDPNMYPPKLERERQ